MLSFSVLATTLPSIKADGGWFASDLYSTQWLMTDQELNNITQAFDQIYNLFAQRRVYQLIYWPNYGWVYWPVAYTYGHLRNYKFQTTSELVTQQITHCESYHEFSTVFYYGHMNFQNVGLPWPEYSYGFREQAAPLAQSANTVWDTSIYDATYPTASHNNHKFVFLWVCHNGNTNGYVPPVHGMPRCWTQQPNLSWDGYGDPSLPGGPDSRPYCFIGFKNASAMFSDEMGRSGPYGPQIYKYWAVFFYYYALNGYTINAALDQASINVGFTYGWLDGDNPLSQGHDYYWAGGGGIGAGDYWGKMYIFGNGNINLPGNIYIG
jgi:hypothetical protein